MVNHINTSKTLLIQPGNTLSGSISIPGDKSISHRAIMLGALAYGSTEVDNFLMGNDALATINAFRTLGVTIDGPKRGRVWIQGVGLHGLQAPLQPIDCGNSGTSMRLLAGILAAQSFDSVLTGDASLSKRPMERIITPLTAMGATIHATNRDTAPLNITGNPHLKGIRYELPVVSAQVKSCLLLAGLYAEGETTVIEPGISRDHTERMLEALAYPIKYKGNAISISSGGKLVPTNITVPGDISSAAFFMVGAAIAPGSDVLLRGVGINPTRIGVINILRIMGAAIKIDNTQQLGGEPAADIHVQYSALQGIDIPMDQVPLAIDEFPALFIAAACAKGVTTLRNAKELRVKESDRIAVMAEGLQRLGIVCEVFEDGLRIEGGQFTGGRVDSQGDHRVAMAFAIASLRANDNVVVEDCANIATSFPNFTDLAQQLGLKISEN